MIPHNIDSKFMAAAIRLARRHEGLSGDNPSVGAIIVKFDNDDPLIVGHGVTAIGGRPHAEPQALQQAGDLAKGATIYVTLEPCAHFGNTPPCVGALIDAGIARVVIAVEDPDPRVAGKGIETLRQAGIEVVTNVLRDQALPGLAGFLSLTERQRPYVTLKLAMTADGIMGARSGEQVKITGVVSNGQVHIMRALADGILVGSETVNNDDPSLTCRLPGLEYRSPKRIILDRQLSISAKSRIIQSADEAPVAIATKSDNEILKVLKNQNVDIISLEGDESSDQLEYLLAQLAEDDISTLLVEGGAQITRSFLEAKLVDRLVIFRSNNEVRDVSKADAVDAPITPQTVTEEFSLKNQMTFGDDVMYEYERN